MSVVVRKPTVIELGYKTMMEWYEALLGVRCRSCGNMTRWTGTSNTCDACHIDYVPDKIAIEVVEYLKQGLPNGRDL